MKTISVKSLFTVLFLCLGSGTSLAGNGHVDKVTDVHVESIEGTGLKQMTVQNSILNPMEIEYLDAARKYLFETFGQKAEKWPIMVDLPNARALYLEGSEGQFKEILFERQ